MRLLHWTSRRCNCCKNGNKTKKKIPQWTGQQRGLQQNQQVVNGAEEQSRCSRYRLDVVRNLSAQGYVPGRDVNLTDLQQEPCVDGWSYSKDIYQSTIVTEFDLVCSDQWKQPFTSTIYFIGVLCGSFVSGQLSDRFGRKPVFFITLGVQTLFTLLQVFSTSWTMFSVLMFFSGLGQVSNYVSAFVLGAEVLSGNVRTVFTSLGVCLGFALGYMMLPLFAFFLRQWRFLLLAISLPGAVFIPLWWITPESPRWLLSQGRVEEAEAIVRKAANMNKVKAPPIIFEDYKSEDDTTKEDKHYTVIDLFRTGEIRAITLILALLWYTMATGYFGLSLNTSKLSADPYISCFVSAAVEVPAYIGTWLALKYLPRRLSIIFSMCLGGVAWMVIQAIPESLPALSVTLAMIGKFSFATNTGLLFPCTAEIYPTALRNTATGTFCTFSRVGICLSPFVFQLSAYFKFLPYIILGSMSIASAIVTLFLPETFGQPLPQTFEEVQKFKSIMPNGFGAFTLVFLTDVPPHHCVVPEANLTEEWQQAAIPRVVVNGKQEQSRCSRYRLDVVRNLSAQGYVPGRDVNLTDLQQEPCVDGWSYSKDIYQSTLTSEFDLVCHDEWKQPFTASVFYAGVTCGSFFSGELSDKFGRKPILFGTMAVQTVFTFIQVFSNSWIMFTVLLFFNGLGQMSNFVAALVLGAEILTGHARVMYSSVATNSAFALGYMMLPLFAYFLRDWRGLLLGLSLPGLAYIPMWWLIPESPRWLLSRGKVKEAEAVIRKAARWNKVQAPQYIFDQFSVPEKEKGPEKNFSALDLFRISSVRVTTLNLFLIWFIMFLAYYALSLNTSQLHTDPYLSCFISALVELPAYVCSWLTLRYFPRRASIIAALCLGAVPLYLIQVVPDHVPTATLIVEMLAKFSFTAGTCLMFTYTSELYPTPLRNTATGTCSMVSRIGSCVAPFLLKLCVFLKFLPHITLATLALLAAFVTLFIPESFGHPLPETFEQMATRESIQCPCQRRKEPRRTMVPAEDPL